MTTTKEILKTWQVIMLVSLLATGVTLAVMFGNLNF